MSKEKEAKVLYWRGVSGKNVPKAPPVLELF
jgi:hypothetical protein